MELPLEDIQKILQITTNLNNLSTAALRVYNEIEALRALKDVEYDENATEPVAVVADPNLPVNRTNDHKIVEELTLQEMGL